MGSSCRLAVGEWSWFRDRVELHVLVVGNRLHIWFSGEQASVLMHGWIRSTSNMRLYI